MDIDPIARFAALFEEYKKVCPVDPNAMLVATVGADGRPSARVTLLKGFDAKGFVFYTNLRSRKGRELLANPACALCFYWPQLQRQVRVEGDAERVSDAEADAYFATRARGSQVGAWASLQSDRLAQRADLEARVTEIEARYRDQPIPRPPHWSGFRVVPRQIELWTSRPSRLHERELYWREGGSWKMELLYP